MIGLFSLSSSGLDRVESGGDALDGLSNIEIADLPSVPIGIEQDLEIAIGVAFEARRNVAKSFALILDTCDARFDAFDEAATFLFGDGGANIGDKFASPIRPDLCDPAVGNHDGGLNVLAALEKLLRDTAEASEA